MPFGVYVGVSTALFILACLPVVLFEVRHHSPSAPSSHVTECPTHAPLRWLTRPAFPAPRPLQPIAYSSGIPEVKCYLNGVRIPRYPPRSTNRISLINLIFTA